MDGIRAEAKSLQERALALQDRLSHTDNGWEILGILFESVVLLVYLKWLVKRAKANGWA